MNEYLKYICKNHDDKKNEQMLSPCRYKCKFCKKKKLNGYSNPDHVTNPFGYLYLVPVMCIDCSIKKEKCMWCDYTD